MKTTERFDKAVTKLYNAFHNRTLDAFRCASCAVGQLLESSEWGGGHDFINEKYRPLEVFCKNNSGYSEEELYFVEKLFMESHLCKNSISENEKQFNGLCAVIKYLCELDNIPNVMDYTKLFETEYNKPKYQLA